MNPTDNRGHRPSTAAGMLIASMVAMGCAPEPPSTKWDCDTAIDESLRGALISLDDKQRGGWLGLVERTRRSRGNDPAYGLLMSRVSSARELRSIIRLEFGPPALGERYRSIWIVDEGTATTVFTTPAREGTFKESELSANDRAAIDSLLAQSTVEDWDSRVDPFVNDAEMYLVCVDRPELRVGCGLYTYPDPDISKRPASMQLVEVLTTLRPSVASKSDP